MKLRSLALTLSAVVMRPADRGSADAAIELETSG